MGQLQFKEIAQGVRAMWLEGEIWDQRPGAFTFQDDVRPRLLVGISAQESGVALEELLKLPFRHLRRVDQVFQFFDAGRDGTD